MNDMRIELYHLATDAGEQRDVAADHSDIIKRIAEIMRREHTDSEAFPIKAINAPAR